MVKKEPQSIDILAFEAFSRLCSSSDSLTQILESYFIKLLNGQTASEFFGMDRKGSGFSEMCNLVSPYDKSFPKSKKITEEQYAFFFSLKSTYLSKFLPYRGGYHLSQEKTLPSFSFAINSLDTIDFGTIDLSNFPGDEFILKGRIRVSNASDKQLIIAPYYDNFTQCDKKSYRLAVNDTIEINFQSKINVLKAKDIVRRTIKIVDDQTKEEKTVWIKANFINYKKN